MPEGRVVADAEDAVRAAEALGGAVALKASSPALRHKSEAGALALGVSGPRRPRRVRARRGGRAARAPTGRRRPRARVEVLVEAMAPPGVELLVAARRDAVVPALVVGLGGIWTELLDDVAIVPLPASPERVETRAALAARAPAC